MYRVGGRRHQSGVAGAEQHPHQVGQALFGPDGEDNLGLGVDLHAETALVQVGDGEAQVRQPARRRITVVAGVARRFGQFLDRHRRAGDVRVAEAEVDYIVAGMACLVPQLVDGREHVRR